MVVAAVERYRLTTDQYERMAEQGILRPEDRVELIQGDLVKIAAIGSRHAACVRKLDALLSTVDAQRSVQQPLRLDDRSEPEPDFALLLEKPDFYASGHPIAEDVLLLVEVSDTSLAFDREIKIPLYARAGIREVWVVDLSDRVIVIHRQPGAGGYETIRRLAPGARISPLAFPNLEIPVDDVLV